jgi:membrane-associated phospholipid phosphatase
MLTLVVAITVLTAQQIPTPGESRASVYRVKRHVDIPVTVAASLALALPYAFGDHLIKQRCPCDPREVNSFDRAAIGNRNPTAATLSDATLAAVVLVPVTLDMLRVGSGQTWTEDVLVFGETLAINGALVTAAKFIVQRPLPRTYAGDSTLLHNPDGYRSFYSGHTSFVFAGLSATAMTIRLRYGEKTWPWILTGLVGTSVAIERVADGRHFPTDVIAGAIMGTAVGIAVPHLHARHGRSSGGVTIAPTGDGALLIGVHASL